MTIRAILATTAVAALILAGCNKEEAELARMETPKSEAAMAGAPVQHAPGEGVQVEPGMGIPSPPEGAVQPAQNNMADGVVPPPPPAGLTEDGTNVSLAGVKFTIGNDWKKVPTASKLRAAQYELPGPGGAGEAIVFYFGPGQGGDAKANIDRWVGQFKQSDETSPSQELNVATLDKDGMKVALVKTGGTYSPAAMGPMVPAGEPKADYALFGMVIEGGPKGSIFIRATGPKATIDAQTAALEALANSVAKAPAE